MVGPEKGGEEQEKGNGVNGAAFFPDPEPQQPPRAARTTKTPAFN